MINKNKDKILEIIRYLIVGVLTTVVSLGIYYGLVYTILNPNIAWQLQLANILSWIGAVIFAYFTNRKYVFKSKDSNKAKEASKFVGSRVLTLVMDMGIMFLGVTVLKQNDKIIKLVSQVVITIANYLFSKLFVFNKDKNENKVKKEINHEIFYYYLWMIPFVDLLLMIIPNQDIVKWIGYIVKGALLFVFMLSLWKKKWGRGGLIIAVGYLIVEVLYLYCNSLNIMDSMASILKMIYLPISLLFFAKYNHMQINQTFISKIFMLYYIILIILFRVNPSYFYYIKKEVFSLLIVLLPIMIDSLISHHNWVSKVLGFSIILYGILLWHSRILSLVCLSVFFYECIIHFKHMRRYYYVIILFILAILLNINMNINYLQKDFSYDFIDSTFLGNRFSTVSDDFVIFQSTNIEEQVFGTLSIPEIGISKTGIDVVDMLFTFGYVGLGIYLLLMIYALWKTRIKGIYLFSFILSILASVFYGGVLTSASIAIFLGTITNASGYLKKKKILLVSNMYPSNKYPHYGSFVQNTRDILIDNHYQVDKVVLTKKNGKLNKVFGYIIFYIRAFFKSMFESYDYFYIHFLSHSGYPLIPAIVTSHGTIVVCNAHGNDVVPDRDIDEKNVLRSKAILKYANKVIVPSSYFKAVMVSNYKIEPNRIYVYPSGGINFDVFKDMSKEDACTYLELDPKYTYFGMVSRLEKDKGWDTLLQAIYDMQSLKSMKNVKVLVIGSGAEEKEFQQMVKDLKLEDIIIHKSFVPQNKLVYYYHAMDLFIFPTRRKSESLGLVGLEAMACHTFVIANDSYGPKEYIKNNVNSLGYEEDQDLEKDIRAYLRMSKANKENIIQKGYNTSLKYDIRHMSDKLKDIFGE